MICCMYQLSHLIYQHRFICIQYTFTNLSYICQFYFFKVLINVSTTTESLSLCVKYIAISLSCNYDLIDLL